MKELKPAVVCVWGLSENAHRPAGDSMSDGNLGSELIRSHSVL